jgi:hypothetical protein
MAGSLKWFSYQDDAGTDWALFGDESNIEAVHGATGSGAPPNQKLKPPSNMKPRYAVFSNQAGTRNVKVPILTQTIYNALDATDTIPDALGGVGATLSLSRVRPEVISPIPTAFDTGLDDGDN